jgi:hypothetical protein
MPTPKVYLVGGHITPFVGKGSPAFKKGSKGLSDYMQEAVQGALKETVCFVVVVVVGEKKKRGGGGGGGVFFTPI